MQVEPDQAGTLSGRDAKAYAWLQASQQALSIWLEHAISLLLLIKRLLALLPLRVSKQVSPTLIFQGTQNVAEGKGSRREMDCCHEP